MLVSVQVHIHKQARQDAAALYQPWTPEDPSVFHPLHNLFCAFLGKERPFTHPITLVSIHAHDQPMYRWEFHILLNTGTTSPLLLSQVITWVSSCPYQIKSLPSFEPVVTAAAVVPDARPTGLECFPALPGILSPLGFSMFAVFCISGSYCQCLKGLSWYHNSGFSMTDLFFHCYRPGRGHKPDREWVGEHQTGSHKGVPSTLLIATAESRSSISSPVKQGWSFPSPILMLHSSISQSHFNPGVLGQCWNLPESPNNNLNSVWDLLTGFKF